MTHHDISTGTQTLRGVVLELQTLLYYSSIGMFWCTRLGMFRRIFTELLSSVQRRVMCAWLTAPSHGSAEYSRLELFHSGGWGTVCNNVNRFLSRVAFGAGAADVTCRQLGYRQGFQIHRLVWFFPGGRRWYWSVWASFRIPAWSPVSLW